MRLIKSSSSSSSSKSTTSTGAPFYSNDERKRQAINRWENRMRASEAVKGKQKMTSASADDEDGDERKRGHEDESESTTQPSQAHSNINAGPRQPPEEEVRAWRSNRRRLSGVVARNRRDSRGSLLEYVDVSVINNSTNSSNPFSDSEDDDDDDDRTSRGLASSSSASAAATRRTRQVLAPQSARFSRLASPTPAKRLQQLEQAQAISRFFESLGGREA